MDKKQENLTVNTIFYSQKTIYADKQIGNYHIFMFYFVDREALNSILLIPLYFYIDFSRSHLHL